MRGAEVPRTPARPVLRRPARVLALREPILRELRLLGVEVVPARETALAAAIYPHGVAVAARVEGQPGAELGVARLEGVAAQRGKKHGARGGQVLPVGWQAGVAPAVGCLR